MAQLRCLNPQCGSYRVSDETISVDRKSGRRGCLPGFVSFMLPLTLALLVSIGVAIIALLITSPASG